MDEGEEEVGAVGAEEDGEDEGEGDAEVMLGHRLALVGGVGLKVSVEFMVVKEMLLKVDKLVTYVTEMI